jgi:hypothetical protein
MNDHIGILIRARCTWRGKVGVWLLHSRFYRVRRIGQWWLNRLIDAAEKRLDPMLEIDDELP